MEVFCLAGNSNYDKILNCGQYNLVYDSSIFRALCEVNFSVIDLLEPDYLSSKYVSIECDMIDQIIFIRSGKIRNKMHLCLLKNESIFISLFLHPNYILYIYP